MRNSSCAESLQVDVSFNAYDFAGRLKNDLSGKYAFHSMEKVDSDWFPTYILESPPYMPGYPIDKNIFLRRKKGQWCFECESIGRPYRQYVIFHISTAG